MSEKVKKVFNKILLYLGITFLVVLGLLLACVIYLFVYPDGSIFGVSYTRIKGSYLYSANMVGASKISGVQVNTSEYDVDIQITDQLGEVRAYLINDVAGYVKGGKNSTKFEMVINPETNYLEMATVEVKGIIFKNESTVRVVIPEEFFESREFDIVVKVKDDANISISGDEKFASKVGLLDLTVKRGDINFDDISIDCAKIKASRSKITAGADVVGTIRELALDIGNSKVNLMYAGNAEKECKKENPDYSAIDFYIEKVNLIGARKNAKISILKCGTVVSASNIKLQNGELNLYFLDNIMDINSKNFDVKIGTIKLNTTSSGSVKNYPTFNSTGSGGIVVDVAESVCSFKTNSGDIGVGQAKNTVILETKSGDVCVDEAFKNLNIISNSGDIDVTFAEDLGDYQVDSITNTNNGIRRIDFLRVGSSKVNIVGVDNINLSAGNNAKLNIEYHKVVEESVYELNGSKANIVVPMGGDLHLKIEGDESLVGVDVGVYKREKSNLMKGVKIDEIIYTDSTSNIINIKAKKGELNIVSDDLV